MIDIGIALDGIEGLTRSWPGRCVLVGLVGAIIAAALGLLAWSTVAVVWGAAWLVGLIALAASERHRRRTRDA